MRVKAQQIKVLHLQTLVEGLKVKAKLLVVKVKAQVDSLLVVVKVVVAEMVVVEVVEEDKVEVVEAKVAGVKVVGAEDQVVEVAAVVWEVQEVVVLEEVRWAAVVEDKWVVQEVLRAREAKVWAKMVIYPSNNNNRWLAFSPTNHLRSSALAKFQSKEASLAFNQSR